MSDKKFVLVSTSIRGILSVCRARNKVGTPAFVMSEEEALERVGGWDADRIRIFEVVERKIETKKVFV